MFCVLRACQYSGKTQIQGLPATIIVGTDISSLGIILSIFCCSNYRSPMQVFSNEETKLKEVKSPA